MSDIKCFKMPRGKKETIIKYRIPLTSLTEQENIVERIKDFSEQIDAIKGRMSECDSRKQAILDKYLK